MNSDLSQFRPLLDTITAHVPECSGYEITASKDNLLGVYFKYPGGEFPLMFDPTQPLPCLVNLVSRGLYVWRGILALQVPTWEEVTIPA